MVAKDLMKENSGSLPRRGWAFPAASTSCAMEPQGKEATQGPREAGNGLPFLNLTLHQSQNQSPVYSVPQEMMKARMAKDKAPGKKDESQISKAASQPTCLLLHSADSATLTVSYARHGLRFLPSHPFTFTLHRQVIGGQGKGTNLPNDFY